MACVMPFYARLSHSRLVVKPPLHLVAVLESLFNLILLPKGLSCSWTRDIRIPIN